MAWLFTRRGNPTPLALAAFGLLLVALHYHRNVTGFQRPRRHRRPARDAAVDPVLDDNLQLAPEESEAAAEVVERAADAGESESQAEHFKQPGSEGQQERTERKAGPGLE